MPRCIAQRRHTEIFSGHGCASIPDGVRSCDHAVERIPPVSRWGRVFAWLRS